MCCPPAAGQGQLGNPSVPFTVKPPTTPGLCTGCGPRRAPLHHHDPPSPAPSPTAVSCSETLLSGDHLRPPARPGRPTPLGPGCARPTLAASGRDARDPRPAIASRCSPLPGGCECLLPERQPSPLGPWGTACATAQGPTARCSLGTASPGVRLEEPPTGLSPLSAEPGTSARRSPKSRQAPAPPAQPAPPRSGSGCLLQAGRPGQRGSAPAGGPLPLWGQCETRREQRLVCTREKHGPTWRHPAPSGLPHFPTGLHLVSRQGGRGRAGPGGRQHRRAAASSLWPSLGWPCPGLPSRSHCPHGSCAACGPWSAMATGTRSPVPRQGAGGGGRGRAQPEGAGRGEEWEEGGRPDLGGKKGARACV